MSVIGNTQTLSQPESGARVMSRCGEISKKPVPGTGGKVAHQRVVWLALLVYSSAASEGLQTCRWLRSSPSAVCASESKLSMNQKKVAHSLLFCGSVNKQGGVHGSLCQASKRYADRLHACRLCFKTHIRVELSLRAASDLCKVRCNSSIYWARRPCGRS